MPRSASAVLEREAGIEQHQPGHRHQQRAGDQKGDEHPHAARRALEMIEQQRQHQQLCDRARGHRSARPRARPTTACRQAPARTTQSAARRSAASAIAESAGNRASAPRVTQPDRPPKMPTSEVDHGSDSAISTATISAVCRPGGGIAPEPAAPDAGRCRRRGAHALPPRARSTSEVVLWPGRISTSTTSPPSASTISWPTTCSRV